jgi:hypothetical protein
VLRRQLLLRELLRRSGQLVLLLRWLLHLLLLHLLLLQLLWLQLLRLPHVLRLRLPGLHALLHEWPLRQGCNPLRAHALPCCRSCHGCALLLLLLLLLLLEG